MTDGIAYVTVSDEELERLDRAASDRRRVAIEAIQAHEMRVRAGRYEHTPMDAALEYESLHGELEVAQTQCAAIVREQRRRLSA
jgi:hypothetical protein